MKVCAVSFKECWRDKDGAWLTDGGFPFQMAAIASLFDQMTLVICEAPERSGGSPLPVTAEIVPLRTPEGSDARRKLSVLFHIGYYLRTIAQHARKADVVHVPLPGDIALLGLLVSLVLRKRVIARYCSSWPETTLTTPMNRLTKWLMRKTAGGRNVMFATGDAAEAPASGVSWLHTTSLSRKEIETANVETDRGLNDPPRLVYLGRLSEEKGVDVLIRAMALLKKQQNLSSLSVLTLAGDGPRRTALENLAREEGLTNKEIVFAGQLNRIQLGRLLKESDLAVHASRTEGMCKAWLDAMAYGLPIIATDVGAASVVIGSPGLRGWLAPPGQVKAFADRVESVLRSDENWPAIRHRCREYAKTRTLESWSERIAEVCTRQWGVSFADGRLK